MKTPPLEIARDVEREYADLFTPEARAVLAALARFEPARRTLMQERLQRRAERAATKTRISFLDPNSFIPRTTLRVRDAREGKFAGPEIPPDLKRQWIQGTGPAARPQAPGGAAQHCVRAPVGGGRLDVRRRGRAGAGRDDVARQRAESQAGHGARRDVP